MPVLKKEEMLLNAFTTLFHSWGSDTPNEVFWGANELLDCFEAEFNVQLNVRFEDDNFEEVMEVLVNVITSM